MGGVRCFGGRQRRNDLRFSSHGTNKRRKLADSTHLSQTTSKVAEREGTVSWVLRVNDVVSFSSESEARVRHLQRRRHLRESAGAISPSPFLPKRVKCQTNFYHNLRKGSHAILSVHPFSITPNPTSTRSNKLPFAFRIHHLTFA